MKAKEEAIAAERQAWIKAEASQSRMTRPLHLAFLTANLIE